MNAVEFASDDSAYEDEEEGSKLRSGKRRLRKQGFLEDGDSEVDDLVPETESDVPESKLKSKRKKKAAVKQQKTVEKQQRIEQVEGEVDEKDTITIDNLPNEEGQILTMLKDVRRHIRQLEKQFFEEEDSDEVEKV